MRVSTEPMKTSMEIIMPTITSIKISDMIQKVTFPMKEIPTVMMLTITQVALSSMILSTHLTSFTTIWNRDLSMVSSIATSTTQQCHHETEEDFNPTKTDLS